MSSNLELTYTVGVVCSCVPVKLLTRSCHEVDAAF